MNELNELFTMECLHKNVHFSVFNQPTENNKSSINIFEAAAADP